MDAAVNELEVRCFCRRTPLLAVCGRDSGSGQPFVHVKAFKQNRIFAEVVITSGTAHIRCRECMRFHKVTIKHVGVTTKPERLPETIAL